MAVGLAPGWPNQPPQMIKNRLPRTTRNSLACLSRTLTYISGNLEIWVHEVGLASVWRGQSGQSGVIASLVQSGVVANLAGYLPDSTGGGGSNRSDIRQSRGLTIILVDQGPRTKYRRPRTKDQGPKTEEQGPRTKDRRPRTEDQGPRTKDRRPRTKDQGPRTEDQEPRTEDQGASIPKIMDQ